MQIYLSEIMYDVNYQFSTIDTPVNLQNGTEFGALLARLQHHGFPTPLLDWTLSPYIAAYFAFKGAPLAPKPLDSVSIFMFDIDRWVSEVKPSNNLLDSNLFVGDFVPYATNNQRMVRQMGVTTITNVADIQTFIMSKGQHYLFKIDMPASERNIAMKELNLMGINDRTMFPDFDGLCKHLKEVHFDNKQKYHYHHLH
ncbi:FRG domain-containing protein [Photobacterium sp. J15]|uniref:FRG domain-containing protein n=1 Tax=Photobacterium sp. J15 TaxID=265901 RepID=UPI0007E36CFF|nr:FRG domain-containing protein [Photobacterium sp. J15]